MTDLVLMLTKSAPSLDAYTLIAELVEETETYLIVVNPASPMYLTDVNAIEFRTHVIPSAFMDAECEEPLRMHISKDYLSFFVKINKEASHPVCVEYNKFWSKTILEAPSYTEQSDEFSDASELPESSGPELQ